MKSAQIRSYFWSLFSRIQTEYVAIFVSLRILSECGKIRTRNNPVCGHFLRSARIHTFRRFLLQTFIKIKSNTEIKTFTLNSTKFFETFRIPNFQNNYLVISKSYKVQRIYNNHVSVINYQQNPQKGLLVVYLNN